MPDMQAHYSKMSSSGLMQALGLVLSERVAHARAKLKEVDTEKPGSLQGAVWELTQDNLVFVTELAVDNVKAAKERAVGNVKAVGINLLEKTEAILDTILPPEEEGYALKKRQIAIADLYEDDEADAAAGCCVLRSDGRLRLQADVAGGGTGGTECKRILAIPPTLSFQAAVRTITIRLTRSAAVRITICSLQDTITDLLRRWRMRDWRRLLAYLLRHATQAHRQLTAGSANLLTGIATEALACVARVASGGSLFGDRQKALTSSLPDLSDLPGPCEAAAAGETSPKSDDSMSRASTSRPDDGDASAGLRLIVKNSFIEVIEVDAASNIPRVQSLNIFDRQHRQLVLEEDFDDAMAKSKTENLHAAPSLAESDCAAMKRPRHDSAPAAVQRSEEPLAEKLPTRSATEDLAEQLPTPLCAPRKREEWWQQSDDDDEEDLAANLTTVMLRGLPPAFSRTSLIETLDATGFRGRYNFVYMPIDFARSRSLGYALTSMNTPEDARDLKDALQGFTNWPREADRSTDSVCEASWSEPRQCLDEHIDRYRNSPVMHASVPDEYKPAVFVNGNRVAFPAPTRAIRHPRIRHLKASA